MALKTYEGYYYDTNIEGADGILQAPFAGHLATCQHCDDYKEVRQSQMSDLKSMEWGLKDHIRKVHEIKSPKIALKEIEGW